MMCGAAAAGGCTKGTAGTGTNGGASMFRRVGDLNFLRFKEFDVTFQTAPKS
jgi:hypothetical protein